MNGFLRKLLSPIRKTQLGTDGANFSTKFASKYFVNVERIIYFIGSIGSKRIKV